MDELRDQIARSAEKAVAMCNGRGGGSLDYSEASLAVVEDKLAEASQRPNQALHLTAAALRVFVTCSSPGRRGR
jgi:hypothetical protein